MADKMRADQTQATTRPIRILMVAPAGIGGTIQYCHNLCNALAEAGHEVVLATAIENELDPFPRSYRILGVFDRFTPHLGPLRAFLRTARELDPDLIHFQGAQRPEFYLLVWWIMRRLTRARFVWTPQDVLSNSLKPYHRRLLRFVYGRMEHVFLNARQNLGPVVDMFGVPRERITVLPIPDLVAFARRDLGRAAPPEIMLDTSAPMLLCFGLIEERKGIGTLIKAFARLRAMGKTATLLIMGKALTDTAPFETALAETGLSTTDVQMISRYATFEEMNALFERAQAVILPYHSGWNSGVLAAAQGYGRPVIATTVGGFDEVVDHEGTGLLVPPRDEVALADAMARLLDDPALHGRLSAGAMQASAQASWSEVAAITSEIYGATALRPLAVA